MIEVHRHQRLIAVGQDPLERAGRRRLDGAVNLLDAGLARRGEGKIDQRNIDGRDANREAVRCRETRR